MIEAAARSARPDLAVAALKRLAETTQASGTDWTLGIEARSRAVLAEDEGADELYRGAIERLGRGGVGAFLARTHLVYGEWLRRERRRRDAREQLRIAHEMLTEMGMEGFADHAHGASSESGSGAWSGPDGERAGVSCSADHRFNDDAPRRDGNRYV